MNLKNRFGFNFYDIFVYAFCILFGLICFYPLWYVFIGSIVGRNTFSLASKLMLWPSEGISFVYYKAILSGPAFRSSFAISVLRTLAGTLGVVSITGLTAYGVSKKKIPGMKQVNFIFIFTMFFGGGLIPYYLLVKNLGLTHTFWIMILPGVAIGHFVVMRNYFSYSIPGELEDSCLIDGANDIILFFRIVVPISKPMFAAIALFTAIGYWNDWQTWYIFVDEPSLKPFVNVLQDALLNPTAYISMENNGIDNKIQIIPINIQMTLIVINMLPIIMVYPFLQKHFAKGILIGAVKG